MNSKTLSYNHKPICSSTPHEAVEDIEGIVVNEIKTFINQKYDKATNASHALISQAS